jgi:Cu/Ag efflux protein CusF
MMGNYTDGFSISRIQLLIMVNNQVITYTENVTPAGKFRHIRKLSLHRISTPPTASRAQLMRILIAALLATASIFSPLNTWAQSADIESTIKTIDVKSMSLTLEDGKVYKVPEEFNFEGLKAGVKVLVFFTVVDGNRVVDDLQIVQ